MRDRDYGVIHEADPMYEVPGSRLREMTDRIAELTARAERAEAEHRMCSVTEAKLLDRIKRAEAAIRQIHAKIVTRYEFARDQAETARVNGWDGERVAWEKIAGAVELCAQDFAALDSTDPVEAAPTVHAPVRGRLTVEVPDERGGGTATRGALVCAACGVEWPCPDAQRPEERSDAGPKKPRRLPRGPQGTDPINAPPEPFFVGVIRESDAPTVRCACDGCEEKRAAALARSDAGLPADGEERK